MPVQRGIQKTETVPIVNPHLNTEKSESECGVLGKSKTALYLDLNCGGEGRNRSTI